MNVQSHRVYRDLEAPIPIMFWEPLEFVVACALFGFGIIAHVWIIGAIGGFAVLSGAKYLRRGAKRGSVQHLMWSVGLMLDKSMQVNFPASWNNEFTE